VSDPTEIVLEIDQDGPTEIVLEIEDSLVIEVEDDQFGSPTELVLESTEGPTGPQGPVGPQGPPGGGGGGSGNAFFPSGW